MKINRETLTYGIVLGLSLGLSQFGFSIRMDFTSEALPSSEVWASAELYRAFQFYPDADVFLIFLTGVIGGLLCGRPLLDLLMGTLWRGVFKSEGHFV